MKRLFAPGRVIVTPGAHEALLRNGQDLQGFLDRHVRGDWGDEANAEDQRVNDLTVTHSGRILSAYRLRDGGVLWVHTDGSRLSTLVMLPEEDEG